MYKQLGVTIKGLVPLMMHNAYYLTNPLSDFSKLMKSLTSKRNKVDDDHLLIGQLEWVASLYTTEPIQIELERNKLIFGCSGVPCVTGEVLEGMLINGAKKHKLGQQAKTGIICDGNFPVVYDGPKDIVKLWESGNYMDIRNVRVQKNAIMRCRPIFREWRVDFTISYLPDVISEHQIRNILETAGQVVGLCEYRPKFGRFAIDDAA